MTTAHQRRKKKLIEPGLQFRLAFFIFLAACVSTLAQTLTLRHELAQAGATLGRDAGLLAQRVPDVLFQSATITLLLLLPVSLTMGILRMFRIVGPVYRFRVHLGQIARGEKVGPCAIRASDDLHYLKERLNRFTRALRSDEDAPSTTVREEEQPEARLQLRLAGTFLLVAPLTVLVNLIVATNVLGRLAPELPFDGFALKTQIPEIALASFINAFLISAPLTIVIGILATRGVLQRLREVRTFLDGFHRGEDVELSNVSHRKPLHGLVEVVNEVATLVQERKLHNASAPKGAESRPSTTRCRA